VEFFDGHMEAAFSRLKDAVERLAPNEPFALWWTGTLAAFAGREEEAITWLTRKELEPWWINLAGLMSCALRDDVATFDELLSGEELLQMGKTDEYLPMYYASCAARLGEVEKALGWLEQAVSWGFSNHRFLSEHNRFLSSLHGEPRFQTLLIRARDNQQSLEG
jgi:hypothetical protein